jgi:hypothetical protein
LYITIVFWKSCLVFHHVHFYTSVITHVECLSDGLLILIFELLNNCSKLETMFLPAARDVAVSYFVDFLCFPLYACCVDLLCVLACVEVVVLVSSVEVCIRPFTRTSTPDFLCFPSYACCVALLCVFAYVEVVVLVSDSDVCVSKNMPFLMLTGLDQLHSSQFSSRHFGLGQNSNIIFSHEHNDLQTVTHKILNNHVIGNVKECVTEQLHATSLTK